jgi:hypothetical protein
MQAIACHAAAGQRLKGHPPTVHAGTDGCASTCKRALLFLARKQADMLRYSRAARGRSPASACRQSWLCSHSFTALLCPTGTRTRQLVHTYTYIYTSNQPPHPSRNLLRTWRHRLVRVQVKNAPPLLCFALCFHAQQYAKAMAPDMTTSA